MFSLYKHTILDSSIHHFDIVSNDPAFTYLTLIIIIIDKWINNKLSKMKKVKSNKAEQDENKGGSVKKPHINKFNLLIKLFA